MTLHQPGVPTLTRARNAAGHDTTLATCAQVDARHAACLPRGPAVGAIRGYCHFWKRLRYEAFLNQSTLALHMARFPEAEHRRLHKMICMQCYARNAMRATRCRKCGSTELRPKAKEARKE